MRLSLSPLFPALSAVTVDRSIHGHGSRRCRHLMSVKSGQGLNFDMWPSAPRRDTGEPFGKHIAHAAAYSTPPE
jgi:hypothetical protein